MNKGSVFHRGNARRRRLHSLTNPFHEIDERGPNQHREVDRVQWIRYGDPGDGQLVKTWWQCTNVVCACKEVRPFVLKEFNIRTAIVAAVNQCSVSTPVLPGSIGVDDFR